MRQDDFFTDEDLLGVPVRTFNEPLVAQIRAGSADFSDIEVAVPLAHLVHEEFERFGTAGDQALTNSEAREAMSALKAVLYRVGLEFDPPFTDFNTFKTYWIRNGASGSGGWQARRDILSPLFDPAHDQLADLQAHALRSVLAKPVATQLRTGWTRVDEEIAELRRHFQVARTPQDYRNVGNDCVIVLERLSEAAYEAARHLAPGDVEPSVSHTKARLDRVVEVDLVGSSNTELRKLVRAAIEQAQAVKHRTPTRNQAGIAADSVILLANIFRRIVDPSF